MNTPASTHTHFNCHVSLNTPFYLEKLQPVRNIVGCTVLLGEKTNRDLRAILQSVAWASSECLTSAHRKQRCTLLQYIFSLPHQVLHKNLAKFWFLKELNSREYLLRPSRQSPVPDNEWTSYTEGQLVNKIVSLGGVKMYSCELLSQTAEN